MSNNDHSNNLIKWFVMVGDLMVEKYMNECKVKKKIWIIL